MKKYYSIGEVARHTGMPVYLIRYLERYGVVSSVRQGAGRHRRYYSADLYRISLIKKLHDDGLKPKAIKRRLKQSKTQLFDDTKIKIFRILEEIRNLIKEL